jgi:CheY-like chemotaxis protein/HPt (histidine-containing phosphotransfer) domain-containing protein
VVESRTAKSNRPALLGPVRVLLAEDHELNQKVACKMLEDLGATVTVVADGLQAIEALEHETFNLILMDCQMPRVDGFTATARIREIERETGDHIPIIAMTANALEGDRQQCLASGMDDYLSKPTNRRGLLAVLTKWGDKVKGGGVPVGEAENAEPPSIRAGVDIRRFAELQSVLELSDLSYWTEILNPFVLKFKKQSKELLSAIEAGDCASVIRIGHSIKGACRNLGLSKMASLTEKAEFEAKMGKVQNPESTVLALRTESDAVLRFLELRRDKAQGNPA